VQELHGTSLHGRIYVAGGIRQGNAVTAAVLRLDPAGIAWVRVADLPAPRHHMPLVATTDSLYAVGGFDQTGMVPVTTFWLYHEASDRWLARAPLPEPRGASAAGAIEGRIVVVGGVGPRGVLLDSIVTYDPANDRWIRGAPIPTPRDHLAAVVVDDALYAVGGRPLDPDRNFDRLERYDPGTASWITLPPMPTARGGIAAVARDGRIHVLGGETSRLVFAEHEIYDVAAGRWSSAPPLPTPRHGLAAAARNGRLYVIGGGPKAGLAQTEVVEIFDAPP
jgi:N-acetylneuraminic acid mutarotase